MRDGFCALRARRLFAFCSLGRLRRGQGGAGYGAAPPSRPPLHPPRSTPLGFSRFRHSTRAARLLLRELPRCARRSPSAPRNASARLRVAWEIAPDVSSGRVHCILMEDKCDYSWCSVQPDSSLLSVCSFVQPARREGVRACSCIFACRSIERHVPCGHCGFSFYVVLAAYAVAGMACATDTPK